MAKKSKKNRVNIVYSTSEDYEYDYEGHQEEETLPPADQNLRVRIEKNQRGGKIVTIVSGFIGREEDLKVLGKLLKSKCGVGGSVKDGEILIQGDLKPKVIGVLEKEGYNAK